MSFAEDAETRSAAIAARVWTQQDEDSFNRRWHRGSTGIRFPGWKAAPKGTAANPIVVTNTKKPKKNKQSFAKQFQKKVSQPEIKKVATGQNNVPVTYSHGQFQETAFRDVIAVNGLSLFDPMQDYRNANALPVMGTGPNQRVGNKIIMKNIKFHLLVNSDISSHLNALPRTSQVTIPGTIPAQTDTIYAPYNTIGDFSIPVRYVSMFVKESFIRKVAEPRTQGGALGKIRFEDFFAEVSDPLATSQTWGADANDHRHRITSKTVIPPAVGNIKVLKNKVFHITASHPQLDITDTIKYPAKMSEISYVSTTNNNWVAIAMLVFPTRYEIQSYCPDLSKVLTTAAADETLFQVSGNVVCYYADP